MVFALLMPFIAHGPRIEVLGLSLSEPGLLAAWALLVKGTLGVLASLTLAATTEPHDVLRGLERLRLPDLLVQIMGFMIRYLDVVTGEMGRMLTAMKSRGCDPRRPRHWPAMAKALGALFIRSYERGERVHLAMLSRGYTGRLPSMSHSHPRRPRPRLRLSRRPPGPARRRPPRPPGGAGRPARPQRCRQDDAGAPPQRDPHRRGRVGRRWAGCRSVSDNLKEIRRRVGIVFQDPDDQLFLGTVRQDVAFGPANLGLKGEALERRVMESLDQVGMADFADRPPHHLSFGQRRRVAVATVLAMEPEILVLDEPSSNLDPASRRELADILRSLDVTLLMVTHDLPYALELCPRSVVLADGVVVADGTTYDVLTDDRVDA